MLRVLDDMSPWAVINAAGWVRVDEAEARPQDCLAANAEGALRLARACQAHDIPFVTFSSDLVFDGRSDRPYVESDRTAPLNVYGASKAEAERSILQLDARALIVRTAAFFSAYDPHNFAAHVLRTLTSGRVLDAAHDQTVSPTHVPDLVDAVLDLLIDGETGLRHLANHGATTWAQFASQLAAAVDLDPGLVRGVPAATFAGAATRPASSSLGTERSLVMPTLDCAVGRFAHAVRTSGYLAESSAGEPASSTVSLGAVMSS
jgi:dTDP-4-dehydrorhamnose reductase